MIEELSITDLGVIAAARFELSPGLTVLSGETGAGKTMVLTALSLLLGGRADPALVAPGASAASVEGRIAVPSGSAVALRAEQAGAVLDEDGTLLVARTVAAGTVGAPGRSRAHLGGRTVPQAVLAELADALVTVHGQADQARLRSPARQRDALDAFAGPLHQATVVRHREVWTARSQLTVELDDLVTRGSERAREAELLRLGLAEVERVDPQPGEDHALDERIARLAHVEDLRAAAATAHEALSGDDERAGATVELVAAERALEHAGGHDPTLAALGVRLAEARYLVADVATELAAYADDLAADPAGLAAAQQRRAELTGLTRAHGGDVDAVLAWAGEAGLRLAALDGGDSREQRLRAELAQLEAELAFLAGALSAGRREAADRLADAVSAELAALAMGGARLQVVVGPGEPSAHGVDAVELRLAAHHGAAALPLGRTASGGELSRVMLALEVTLAGASTEAPDTFVFDEVDAGVGGRAAVQVGRRLAALARSSQVLVVTHLAQVAAFADHHLVVTKRAGDDRVTASGVREVTGADRVAELARMLSGQEDSATARAHAAELLRDSGVAR